MHHGTETRLTPTHTCLRPGSGSGGCIATTCASDIQSGNISCWKVWCFSVSCLWAQVNSQCFNQNQNQNIRCTNTYFKVFFQINSATSFSFRDTHSCHLSFPKTHGKLHFNRRLHRRTAAATTRSMLLLWRITIWIMYAAVHFDCQ